MFAAYSFNEWVTLIGLGVLLVLGLAVGVGLVAGLFQARSLVRREFMAYFLSPIAYVVFVVFLAVTGHLFYLTLNQLTAKGPRGVEFPMQFMFDQWYFWLVFLFIPPLLTMRLFAEERDSGTLEMLLTAPVRDWQVVLSKFVACFAFYVLLWLPTLVYLPVLLDLHDPKFNPVWQPSTVLLVGGLGAVVLSLLLALPRFGTRLRLVALGLALGGTAAAVVGGWIHYREPAPHLVEVTYGIDPAPVLASYLGIALAGAMFLALGLLVSSLVRNQLVAALIALALSLLFIVGGFWRSAVGSGTGPEQLVYFFSVPLHFSQSFTRGLVDSRPLALYASMAVFCLFLTVRSLEGRRWR
jgi:ABC-type transport system involved in multi-copper enzyme maturation permease subunit